MIDLDRFKNAQNTSYDHALTEIKSGRKKTHWMWYIFPQITGLGESSASIYYAIKSQEEAKAYIKDELLRKRLLEISNELLKLKTNNPNDIFGDIDSMKLCSSMTLFSLVYEDDDTFDKVLEKYFNGKKDERTLKIWNSLSDKTKMLRKENL